MKRFLVVISRPDGGVEVHAMKQWLRQHRHQVPPGLDATTSTSHQLRGALKRSRWSIDENDSEVRLVPPGSGVVDANVGAVLRGEPETEDASEELDPRFGLEYQLREFLVQNIQTIGRQREAPPPLRGSLGALSRRLRQHPAGVSVAAAELACRRPSGDGWMPGFQGQWVHGPSRTPRRRAA